MGARLWVSKLKFRNEKTIDLDKNSIAVFVGPNNGGKSTALKEISIGQSFPNQRKYIFDKISFSSSGTRDVMELMLRNRQVGDAYSFPITSYTIPYQACYPHRRTDNLRISFLYTVAKNTDFLWW